MADPKSILKPITRVIGFTILFGSVMEVRGNFDSPTDFTSLCLTVLQLLYSCMNMPCYAFGLYYKEA